MSHVISESQELREKRAVVQTEATVRKMKSEMLTLFESLKRALTVENAPYDLPEVYPLKDVYVALEEALEDLGVDLCEEES